MSCYYYVIDLVVTN